MNYIFFIALVKTGLVKQNPEEVLSRLNAAITALKDNPNFSDIEPSIAELEYIAKELEMAVINAVDGGRSVVAKRNAIVKKVRVMMGTLTASINQQSNGDEKVAITSGLPLCAQRTRAGFLAAPQNLRAVALGSGRVKFMFKGLKQRTLYFVSVSDEITNPDAWGKEIPTTKNVLVFENLIPGKVYYFRVVGFNRAGLGIYSDAVNVMCV